MRRGYWNDKGQLSADILSAGHVSVSYFNPCGRNITSYSYFFLIHSYVYDELLVGG